MSDSFDNDFMRLMRSNNNPGEYPRYDYEYNLAERDYEASRNLHIVDRIQIQFAEGRHAFLLRHPTRYHWCGYIHIPRNEWYERRGEIESRLSSSIISYALPSFEPICWMVRNVNGFLKKAVDINPDGDFFVGFEMSYLEPENARDHEVAMLVLIDLDRAIQRVTNDHSPS